MAPNPSQGQIDWSKFEQIFGESFPFFQPGQIKNMMNDPAWVQKYVQDVLNKAMPSKGYPYNGSAATSSTASGFGSGSSSELREEVFETHNSVIVRCHLSDSIDPYTLKVRAEPMKLTVSGLPERKSVTIKLPVPIRSQGAKALHQDGILEIRLPKDNFKDRDKVIPIDFRS